MELQHPPDLWSVQHWRDKQRAVHNRRPWGRFAACAVSRLSGVFVWSSLDKNLAIKSGVRVPNNCRSSPFSRASLRGGFLSHSASFWSLHRPFRKGLPDARAALSDDSRRLRARLFARGEGQELPRTRQLSFPSVLHFATRGVLRKCPHYWTMRPQLIACQGPT